MKPTCFHHFNINNMFFSLLYDSFKITISIHFVWHIRMEPACSRGYDNHLIVLSHWNITPQAHSFDILILLSHMFSSIYINKRELQLPISNLWFCLTRRGIKPRTSSSQNICFVNVYEINVSQTWNKVETALLGNN